MKALERFPNTFIHESAYVDEPVEIGPGSKIWHFSHILGRVTIGSDCVFGQNVMVGPDVTIGNRCKIQNNVSIYSGVELEDGVFCGPSCVFTNVNNPRAEVERKSEFRKTLIKRGVTIGANATIVCGHTVGEYAFIAAGAVITTDVAPYALMAGVPARRIGWMSKAGGRLRDDLVCPISGERYELNGDVLRLREVVSQPALIPFIDLDAQRLRLGDRIPRAIEAVLSHGEFIMGPEVRTLEQRLADFTGASYAVTCANGTDALVLVLRAEEIGPGDAVLVPAFTFVATAEAVALVGAVPVFVDVDEVSFNISLSTLADGLRVAQQNGLRPRAIIAVDLFGLPAAYDDLRAFAAEHGLVLIADAAQSFGAEYRGRRVGSLADYTTTSFFPAKPLGCYGDGGAIFVSNPAKAELLRSLRVHGKGDDKYDNLRIGLNSRLDTVQAAVLLEKLDIFPGEIAQRGKIAKRYGAALADTVRVPKCPADMVSVWAQYSIRLSGGTDRGVFQAKLRQSGVPTAIYYPIPLNRQKGYLHYPSAIGDESVAARLAAEVVSLPMHPYLDEPTQDKVIEAVRAAAKGAA